MRTLEIRNIFCFEALDFQIAPGRTLITGPNSAGKTSIARILGAVTAHHSNPAGLSAAVMKTYLRDGSIEGHARIDGGATWRPPKIEVATGTEPEARAHQVGLVDFVSKGDAKVYEDLFLPADPEPLLAPRWQQSSQQLQTVLAMIREHGWKAAYDTYHARQLESRRRWESVTGDRYGARKAAQWRPATWDEDLDGLSEDDVLSALTETQDALRAVGVRHAIEQDRIDRGVNARDNIIPLKMGLIGGLEDDLEVAKAAVAEKLKEGKTEKNRHGGFVKALVELESEYARLNEPPKKPTTYACPECAANL